MDYKKKLERNLKIYVIRGMFERRPYLPIITIYATMIAGVTLAQIGIIASITAVVSLIAEVPSGYISDKLGHKRSLLLGSFLQTISPLCYILWQNFFGACFAMVIFWLGVAFHSGTLQAFVHETLIALGREDDFASVAARERRWAMVGNIILVAVIPLTYHISPILPFIIGFFVHTCALVLYMFMATPQNVHKKIEEDVAEGFFVLLNTVRERGEIVLFIFLGIMASVSVSVPQFRELYFQEIGVPLWMFGLIFSLTGFGTIIFTYLVPYIKKIRSKTFYGIDLLFTSVLCVIIGLVSNPFMGVGLFVLLGSYRRTRSIVINAYLLEKCPTKKFKATYLSLYAFFCQLMGVFAPLVLGGLIGHFGIRYGYVSFGLVLLVVLVVLFMVIYKNLDSKKSICKNGVNG